ncbi:MAG: acyltransferase domain-containing protein [Candidatus Anammoxibacter sp.]
MADDAVKDSLEMKLKDTFITQPAIMLSSIAMLQVFEYLGLKPTISIGHSLGEITALYAAGVFDEMAAVRIAALRGKAMALPNLDDSGAMAAIVTSPDKVEKLIKPFGSSLVIFNYNSPKQTVVSGTSGAIKELLNVCKKQRIKCQQLSVSHAFHSDIVAPAATAFKESLKTEWLNALSGTVVSTSTGKVISKETDIHDLLGYQITRPVRFTDRFAKRRRFLSIKQCACKNFCSWFPFES